MMHSMCGGTGAGLGSRLLEAVRDQLGKTYIMSVSVLPMAAGTVRAYVCLSVYVFFLCLPVWFSARVRVSL